MSTSIFTKTLDQVIAVAAANKNHLEQGGKEVPKSEAKVEVAQEPKEQDIATLVRRWYVIAKMDALNASSVESLPLDRLGRMELVLPMYPGQPLRSFADWATLLTQELEANSKVEAGVK